MKDNEYSIIGHREITKLQKGTKVNFFFNSVFFLLQKW